MAPANGLFEEACSGESVTFNERSKTRIDPRSIDTIRFPLEEAEKEAMSKMMKRSSGPPKTKSKAARLAKNVMKNCFIGSKTGESSCQLRDGDGKDNGFAPEADGMNES